MRLLAVLFSLSFALGSIARAESTLAQVSRTLSECLAETAWIPRSACFKRQVAGIKSDDTYWPAVQAIQAKCITDTKKGTGVKNVIVPQKPDVLASNPELESWCFEAGLGILKQGIPKRVNSGDVEKALNMVRDACTEMALITGPVAPQCVKNGFNALIRDGADHDDSLNKTLSLISKMCLEPTTLQAGINASGSAMGGGAFFDGAPYGSELCIEKILKVNRSSQLRDLTTTCDQWFKNAYGGNVSKKSKLTCYFRELTALSLRANSECAQRVPAQNGGGAQSQ